MKKYNPKPTFAFSLVELLVVIAIVGILTALAVPAFKGLVGASGVRGGVDIVLSAMDQAQAVALEKGVKSYVAFPPTSFGGNNSPLSASQLIVFREKTGAELGTASGPQYTNVSKWLKLPRGVLLKLDRVDFQTSLANDPHLVIPRLENANVSDLRAIAYDRFGSIMPPTTNGSRIEIGEGIMTGTNPTFIGTNAVFTAQRLVGKWTPAAGN